MSASEFCMLPSASELPAVVSHSRGRESVSLLKTPKALEKLTKPFRRAASTPASRIDFGARHSAPGSLIRHRRLRNRVAYHSLDRGYSSARRLGYAVCAEHMRGHRP